MVKKRTGRQNHTPLKPALQARRCSTPFQQLVTARGSLESLPPAPYIGCNKGI